MAGAEVDADHVIDGQNLLPLFRAEKDHLLHQRPIYQYYPFYDHFWGLTPSASIRLGDHKLIQFFGDRIDDDGRYIPTGSIELYDLSQDLGETTDLSAQEPALTKVLGRQLLSWMCWIGAEVPDQNPYYDPTRQFEKTKQKPL